MDQYERLANAFVGLADTLVADYDVVEVTNQLIDHSMTLLPIAAAGIVLADGKGELHVFATSSQQTRLVELVQVHADKGPYLQAYPPPVSRCSSRICTSKPHGGRSSCSAPEITTSGR